MKKLISTLLLSLGLVAGFAQTAAAAPPPPSKGFETMKSPQPVSAPAGKIEVIEFFCRAADMNRGDRSKMRSLIT